jgi:hypothetical protein
MLLELSYDILHVRLEQVDARPARVRHGGAVAAAVLLPLPYLQ